MRCRSCGERWTLECGLAPGGFPSPLAYLVRAAVLLAAGFVVGWLGLRSEGVGRVALGVCLCVFAAQAVLKGLLHCGYHEPATAYQGSVCPKCGKKNRIWPWNR